MSGPHMSTASIQRIVRELRREAETLVSIAEDFERYRFPDLTKVGTAWGVDNNVRITLGYSGYELTVMDARILIAQLVSAIYCAERGGNTEHAESESREARFLEALRGGLFHSLKLEDIQKALRRPSP